MFTGYIVMSRYNILCFICDPCNVSNVMSGVGVKQENPFCGGGLNILRNYTMNINDAHIFLISMLECQGKIYFQKFSRDSKSPLISV